MQGTIPNVNWNLNRKRKNSENMTIFRRGTIPKRVGRVQYTRC